MIQKREQKIDSRSAVHKKLMEALDLSYDAITETEENKFNLWLDDYGYSPKQLLEHAEKAAGIRDKMKYLEGIIRKERDAENEGGYNGAVTIFNPRCTFENFIVMDYNRFAVGAAKAVAQAPGKEYNPLFIYGGHGLGKTHLMIAINVYILKHFPKLQVLYVSSDTFMEEFINASIDKNINVFMEKYYCVDLLLIDDIQFISKKERIIEGVQNICNNLYFMRKQMVFTSDRPPSDIFGLDERINSILSSGLVVDITPPSYEIKVAILKNKAMLDGLPEDEDLYEIIYFIAENIQSNVRDLESAFNFIIAYTKFAGVPFTKELAYRLLNMPQRGN